MSQQRNFDFFRPIYHRKENKPLYALFDSLDLTFERVHVASASVSKDACCYKLCPHTLHWAKFMFVPKLSKRRILRQIDRLSF